MGTTTSALPWAEWIIDRYIGKSENSAYFQVHHEETKERASIERRDLYLPDDFEAQLMSRGASVKEYSDIYLEGAIKRLEIAQMLTEIPGMLGIEEYKTVPNVRAGYTIFIRRRYAQSLAEYLEENTLTLKEEVQAVIELCEAPEACHARSIIYGGVRMDSIYVTEDKHFCLGTDHFFALRNIGEKIDRFYVNDLMDSGAPETLNKGECTPVSDVYTVGMLLYSMFNDGKMPFLPAIQKKNSDLIYQGAIERRLRGEKVFAPANGTPEMIEVILKACEYEPGNRYQSIAELKAELVRLLENDLVVPPVEEDDDVDDEFATSDYKAEMAARERMEAYNQQSMKPQEEAEHSASTFGNNKETIEEFRRRRAKSNKPMIVRIIALLIFVMFIVVQVLGLSQKSGSGQKQQQQTETQQTEAQQAESETEAAE